MGISVDWGAADTASLIAVPKSDDDKYSRGVLGIITGSAQYPGAAVLGVDAALHTGVGMVRYLGDERATILVLQRRPEAVPAPGPVQAWLVGSGMAAAARAATHQGTAQHLQTALASGNPMVIDAGALDLFGRASGPVIITPHFRELARMLGSTAESIAQDPGEAAWRAAQTLGVTVLLKGHRTHLAAADGTRLVTASAPAWLATAGSGDALGGILGALVASHSVRVAVEAGLLARLGATAAVIHALAARRANPGGPFTILQLIDQLPAVIAELLAGRAARDDGEGRSLDLARKPGETG